MPVAPVHDSAMLVPTTARNLRAIQKCNDVQKFVANVRSLATEWKAVARLKYLKRSAGGDGYSNFYGNTVFVFESIDLGTREYDDNAYDERNVPDVWPMGHDFRSAPRHCYRSRASSPLHFSHSTEPEVACLWIGKKCNSKTAIFRVS